MDFPYQPIDLQFAIEFGLGHNRSRLCSLEGFNIDPLNRQNRIRQYPCAFQPDFPDEIDPVFVKFLVPPQY